MTPKFRAKLQNREKRKFIEGYGLKKSRGSICIARINGERCALPPHLHTYKGADHTSLWNKGGQPVCFVSQPYREAFESPEHQAELNRVRELGYFIRVDLHGSWHYLGRTVLVEIWKDKETYEWCKKETTNG
jgi:hypothetical protein